MKKYVLPISVVQSTKNSCVPPTVLMKKAAQDLVVKEKNLQTICFLNKLYQARYITKKPTPFAHKRAYTRPISILRAKLSPIPKEVYWLQNRTPSKQNAPINFTRKKYSIQNENVDESWEENKLVNKSFNRKKAIAEFSQYKNLFTPNFSPKYKRTMDFNPNEFRIMKGDFTKEAENPKILRNKF